MYGVAERRHGLRVVAAADHAEARQIHMVVVVVGDEQQVDLGKIGKSAPGWAGAFRPGPGDGRAALGEDGVGEDGQAADADQEAAMTDEGDGGAARRRRRRHLHRS
jgi:hypothetical protein